MMREEPGGTGRRFVNDLNGPLYIADKTSHAITTYLDFDGGPGPRSTSLPSSSG